MTRCSNIHVARRRRQQLCCYGVQGCTAAHSAKDSSELTGPEQSNGKDPKQANGSEPKPPCPSLQSSQDASIQDLYLLMRALSEGGLHVSAIVQAIPQSESPLLPSDIHERYGCLTAGCLCIECPHCSDALTRYLKSTTPSSKQRDSSNSSHPWGRWMPKEKPEDDEPDGYLG